MGQTCGVCRDILPGSLPDIYIGMPRCILVLLLLPRIVNQFLTRGLKGLASASAEKSNIVSLTVCANRSSLLAVWHHRRKDTTLVILARERITQATTTSAARSAFNASSCNSRIECRRQGPTSPGVYHIWFRSFRWRSTRSGNVLYGQNVLKHHSDQEAQVNARLCRRREKRNDALPHGGTKKKKLTLSEIVKDSTLGRLYMRNVVRQCL